MQNPITGCGLSPDNPDPLWPSRRTVLGGSAALLIADKARAREEPSPSYHLEFVDTADRQFVVLVERPSFSETVNLAQAQGAPLLSWDRRDFGPSAYFKIKRTSAPHVRVDPAASKPKPGEGFAEWLPVVWTLSVRNGAFPGNEGRPFDAEFTFAREKVTSTWKVSAKMSRWWSHGSQLITKPIDLDVFLHKPGASLAFAIGSDGNGMLKSLFGKRVETRVTLDLRVDLKLNWSIESDARLVHSGKSRLFILDVPLEFGKLSLTRIRSDVVKESVDQRAKGDTKESSGSAGLPEQRLLFDDNVLHSRPLGAGNPKLRPDGLYAELKLVTGFTKLPDRQTTWTFDIAKTQATSAETAVSVSLDEAAVTFALPCEREPTKKAQAIAAMRHWGYPDHTVAGVVVSGKGTWGIGRLNVRRGPPAHASVEGPFEFSSLEIVRQFHADRGVVTTLTAAPSTKETTASLQLGGVGLAALPSIAAAPGRAPRVPPIEVEAVDADDAHRRVLTRFEGRFAICNAAVALPERLAVVKEGDNQKPLVGDHATRLEFEDAEAFVYMPAFGSPSPSAADAILPIGAPPRAPKNAIAGKAPAPLRAVFDLGRARLSVVRPSDLLALRFRFSGLELSVPWPPATDAISELSPRGGHTPGRPAAGVSATERDERPLLVVEFPPQHVVERAYLRRYPPTLELPAIELTEPAKEEKWEEFKALQTALQAPKQWSGASATSDPAIIRWRAAVEKLLTGSCKASSDKRPGERTTTGCERVAIRRRMRELAVPFNAPLFHERSYQGPCKTLADFDDLFIEKMQLVQARSCDAGAGVRQAVIPQEQGLYVGPEFLDPDARRIAIEVLGELKAQEDSSLTPGSAADTMPSVTLDPSDWKAILDPLVTQGVLKSLPDQTWPTLDIEKDEGKRLAIEEALQEVERARERRDSGYAEFRRLYRDLARRPAAKVPQALQEYHGQAWFSSALKASILPAAFATELKSAMDAQDQEAFDDIVPSRLSGPSRVAFRVDCEDFEPDRVGGRIPFTLEGLTNWGGMDMAVVRRAERLMEPLEGGRLPPRWGRRALTDEGAILRHQGLTSSDRWGHEHAARGHTPALLAPGPAQRLAEVYAAATAPPDAFETAIELPFRLFLSPAQDATWITSSPRVWREAFHQAATAETVDGFHELWTARLTGKDGEAGLRAVWSPDFRPEALLSTMAPGAPPRGPFAPWALPRSVGLRTEVDRDFETFRTGLEAYDRHELVVLSSLHGLPVLGRRAPSGDIAEDADQIEPPPGFRLRGLRTEKIEGQPADMTAIYRPKALAVSELSLSALGGSLDLDTGFHPPASARFADSGKNLFDALSVQRWRQRTVLGRDIVVEVVYKGFLFPLGHLASLVKLTERRFVAVSDCGPPVAILVQRLFLRVGKKDKRFPAEGQPNRGSRWPCDTVTILTRQSPDLVDSGVVRNEMPSVSGVFAGGKIDLKGSTGLCLWPRTSRRDGAEVWFEMQIGTEAVPVRMPLIFVDNVAANDPATMRLLVAYYNNKVPEEPQKSPTRHVARNGQPVVMAPESKADDTSFPTQWWRIAAEGREATLPRKDVKGTAIDNSLFDRDSFMEGQDQPAFYPIVESAYCRLGPVERHTGRSPLWAQLAYDGQYVAEGFEDAPKNERSEIYLRVLRNEDGNTSIPLNFGDRGDLAGGIARPEMNVVALSRRLGPINSNPNDTSPAIANDLAANGGSPPALPTLGRARFDPESALPDAKFLGILKLKDLIKVGQAVAEQLGVHPKLLEAIEYGAASAEGAAAEIRAALSTAILKPALDAVIEVERAWKKLASERLGGSDLVPTLEEVYPQIGKDIANFENALGAAQDQATPDTAFFESLSLIHEAARRLIRTVEGITRDPLAAAAGAQVELFRKLSRLVETFRVLTQRFAELADLPAKLPGIVQDQLRRAVEAQAAAQLASLRSTPSIEAGEIVKEALADAIAGQPLTLATLHDLPGKAAKSLRDRAAGVDVSTDARDIVQDLADKLSAAAEMADEAASYASQAQAEFDKWGDVAAATRAKIAAVQARDLAMELIASPTFVAIVKLVDTTPWEAFKNFPTDPKKIPEILSALAPMLEILATLGYAKQVRDALQNATNFCGKAKSTLVAATRAVLPDASVVAIKSACVTAMQTEKLPSSCSGSPAVEALFKAATATRDALNGIPVTPDEANGFEKSATGVFKAVDSLAEARTALDNALTAFGATCSSIGPDLPVALRAVVARQRILVARLQDLLETASKLVTQRLLRDVSLNPSKDAFDAAMDLVADILSQVQAMTMLGNVANPPLFKALGDRLTDLAKATESALPNTAKALNKAAADVVDIAALKTRQAASQTAAGAVLAAKAGVSSAANDAASKVKQAINEAVHEVARSGDAALDRVEQALLGDVYNLFVAAAAPVSDAIKTLTDGALPVVNGVVKVLAVIYDKLTEARDELTKAVSKDQGLVINRVLDVIANELSSGSKREDLFQVGKPDELTKEANFAREARDAAASGNVPRALIKLGELAKLLKTEPALVTLFKRFAQIDGAFLRVVIVEALDLRALRAELERIVRELVPSRATLSYDLSTPVKRFPDSKAAIFIPASETRLDIKARTVVDLQNFRAPDARIDGSMGPFGIRLLGELDFVTLNFRGLEFRAGGGRSAGFDVRFGDVTIGEAAQFLKQLESYISPKGGRPPVRPLKDRPGIEASYGINLGSFGVGTLSFSNVSLNAGARLPFGSKEEAEFFISIGRSDAPFLISSTIFGGGGYLELLANSTGFIGLQTSFDYGGVFAFGFGPLTGAGQITLGLYFRAAKGESAKIGMNFMARGAANIACFGFSASLFVRLTYQDSVMEGTATYSFSFSLVVDDIEFTFDVHVSQGASAGQGAPNKTTFLDVPGLTGPTRYASAFTNSLMPSDFLALAPQPKARAHAAAGPLLRVDAPSQETDWLGHRGLFDDALQPLVSI